MARPDGDDLVLPVTRVVAAVIVPALVTAFIMLYLFPARTEQLFAWPVRPEMTSMMLGATYLGGAYFFARVGLAERWHHVSLGILPVAVLCVILGLATWWHWDRFTHDHVSFWLWVLLYFGLPFVLPAVLWLNERSGGRAKTGGEVMLPRSYRVAFAVFGAVLTGVGLVLLVSPATMIDFWPWTLTPLTARVMSAMFTLTGLIGVSIAVDGRWSASRYILQAQLVAVTFFLLAVLRARGEWDWSRAVSWFFLGGLMLVFALVTLVLVQFERRAGRVGAPEAPVTLP
jgi:hypothetical protein